MIPHRQQTRTPDDRTTSAEAAAANAFAGVGHGIVDERLDEQKNHTVATETPRQLRASIEARP
jgi:hypothetical protein